jgi:UDP-glucose 4-epimerase
VNGDGSAIRDYLHISDAADAFVAGVEHLPKSGLTTYNIGSGSGVSVAEVISAVERATERKVSVEHRPPADEPIKLVCDPTKAIKELEWSPSRSSIDAIVRDAWSSSLDAR